MDYLLTAHIPLNAVFIIIPVLAFLLVKHFFSFDQGIYRSFYLIFIIATIEALINARPEQATTTYWAYLIIVVIFTYENSMKSAVIMNSLAFCCLSVLAVLDYISFIELPFSQFNYLSFLMIYVVLSIFVYIMVKNFSDIEAILHRQSKTLQDNVDELNKMQKSLIESEKMAALGGLVAGISHEINTPLGIALTAITHNQDMIENIEQHLHDETLKRSTLKESIDAQQHGYRIILNNLERANDLISHFKQVAVDQASESLREIYIHEYIQDIINSMYSLTHQKNIQVHLQCPDNIKVNTYPGPIYQIISNFINNSLLHGFEHQTEGNITISVTIANSKATLVYLDDGIGMSHEILTKIFEPFVTSKRNQGGSGLGMNIVYNLVTQVLEGQMTCQSSPGNGIEISLSFPVEICSTGADAS
ncbi:MAG: HAMP domain-containing histidine kinase [Colwellia sp.]|nr:HAMP domain-containing histidine kinase [Colwellia sp.]MCW8865097.1 HAMP domain-containing histidine kinase [Colwellia sp.]MCW9082910.1 HAMP domain-containing histidine kinase [Colwellia sp.]